MYESYGTYVNDEYVDNHDYDDNTDDDNDHEKDSYAAAGAAPTQTRSDSGEQKKTITIITTTLVGLLAGVLKIKIQLGRSLTRRRELRRPSTCLLYTSPSPRDLSTSRMPSSA